MNRKQKLSPIPNQWLKSLSIRPPDFRALIATWVDPVVRRKGLSIYEEMLLDPQVYASLNLLKFAALSLDFTVGTREEGGDPAVAQEVEALLESFPGGLMEFMYNTLSALEYGWSITELVWGAKEDKKWVPVKWIPLPQAIYGFKLDDDTGEPDAVRTWFAPMTQGMEWPLEDFVILRWNSRFGSPYGRSQLLAAYESWWVKQLLRRMRNTTLDRYGTPLMIAKVPKKYDQQKRQALANELSNLYAETGLVIDDDVNLEMPNTGAGQGASAGFQGSIEYEDAQISKAITGVTLNSNESRGTGTYAQARVHQDNFLYWVGRVSKMLEEAIQRQVVDRYCRYNYNLSPEETPTITFSAPDTDDVDAMAQLFLNATTVGLVDPQNSDRSWMREKLGFPTEDSEQRAASPDLQEFFKRLTEGYGDNEEEGSVPEAPTADEEDVGADDEGHGLTGRTS